MRDIGGTRDRNVRLSSEYFHVEWPNRSIYHAMFNTERERMPDPSDPDFLAAGQSTGLAAD